MVNAELPTWPGFTLAIALVILVGLIAAWDVYCGYSVGSDATVSSILQGWAQQFPVLALAVGLVLGHLFWPLRKGPR